LKGKEHDDVILVTDNETFLVRRAEMSNLLLVVNEPRSKEILIMNDCSNSYSTTIGNDTIPYSSSVVDSGNTFLEIVKTRPRFNNIIEKLVTYKGPDEEKRLQKQSETYMSVEELDDIVQSSPKQLQEYLEVNHCVIIHSIFDFT
jgi:hypothetical protein